MSKCLWGCLFLYQAEGVLPLSMCVESLFGSSRRRWCSVCGSSQSCGVCDGKRKRERRGVCSGQRPPAAINHADSRSTAHEALRPMPASLGGGSHTELKIHPFPLLFLLPRAGLSTAWMREIKKRGKRGGGGEGERNLSALLGHITQFSLPTALHI